MDSEKKDKRNSKIASLRSALSQVPIISKNVSMVTTKLNEINNQKKDGTDSLSNAKTN